MKVLEGVMFSDVAWYGHFGRGWPACMTASRAISDDRLDSRHSAGVNVEYTAITTQNWKQKEKRNPSLTAAYEIS